MTATTPVLTREEIEDVQKHLIADGSIPSEAFLRDVLTMALAYLDSRPASPPAAGVDGKTDAIIRTIQSWLDWQQHNDPLCTDETYIRDLPVPKWPSRGMFKEWIKHLHKLANSDVPDTTVGEMRSAESWADSKDALKWLQSMAAGNGRTNLLNFIRAIQADASRQAVPDDQAIRDLVHIAFMCAPRMNEVQRASFKQRCGDSFRAFFTSEAPPAAGEEG
jgi:hypothetical protein